MITLSMWASVQTTTKICSQFFKNIQNLTFLSPYQDEAWKCIQMSENKPNIGLLVLEIAHGI